MIEDLVFLGGCRHVLSMHVMVYDDFVDNIKTNSSAPLDVFLREAFSLVDDSFRSGFRVGLSVHYVDEAYINGIALNPPVVEHDKEEMRRHYFERDREGRRRLDSILYDYTLEDHDRPHIILQLVGVDKVVPECIDFYTWHMYL